jgi:hypothetical protein
MTIKASIMSILRLESRFPPDETVAPLRDPADSFKVVKEQYPRIARQYFENKVLSHSFAGGHSSYVLIQRPTGEAPFLLLHSVEGRPHRVRLS